MNASRPYSIVLLALVACTAFGLLAWYSIAGGRENQMRNAEEDFRAELRRNPWASAPEAPPATTPKAQDVATGSNEAELDAWYAESAGASRAEDEVAGDGAANLP